ncbi:MAG: excalibur calcium-binding domain-containing protein [Thermomicrobiales bacterium]|nr:excalibur calcium-binding domain-containing protein [Thermomicrobiales bacterium]
MAAALGLGSCPALAQTESATAEDGAPASEAPGPTTSVPDVPLGANLTPPVGIAPPVLTPGGVGQSGSASVSHTPGTLTSGNGRNRTTTETVPAGNTSATANGPGAAAPPTDAGSAPQVQTCADFPTWYDAQLALESSIDPAQQRELDPDGDTIACEEYMYPG